MSFALSEDDLSRLFPAFLKVAGDGRIMAIGPSLERHAGTALIGADLQGHFEIQRPLLFQRIGDLLTHKQQCHLVLRANPAVKLQGTVQQDGADFYLLVGHIPSLDATPDTPQYKFSDFAPFDGARDMLLSAQLRKGLLHDVENLVEHLKREKTAAEAANAAKGEFLACMSHEIRTPLNGILGLAALLDNSGLDDRQDQLLCSLRACGLNLLELLNDIIETARMDTDRFAIHEEEVSLDDLLARLRERYLILANDKTIMFEICVDPALKGIRILSDTARLTQVLNNLVSNAVKFTEKGSVTLKIDGVGGTNSIAHRLRFQVTDTGIGIAPDDIDRIFEPFTQADAGVTRRFGGTGLGLTICQRIVDAMGGTVDVASQIHEGSVFTVTVPLRRANVDRDVPVRKRA